jgi:hypothetical protein
LQYVCYLVSIPLHKMLIGNVSVMFANTSSSRRPGAGDYCESPQISTWYVTPFVPRFTVLLTWRVAFLVYA